MTSRRVAAAAAIALAGSVLVLGVVRGSTVAGGADSSGYLSQAAAISEGRLLKELPLARRVSLPDAEWAMAPLGWRPSGREGVIAPIYPTGYPLALAIALTLGGARSMLWVVPAFGALAVWCTYLVGRRMESPATGVVAAGLLASSPPFVFQVLQPMSDVPATALWAAAVALAAAGSPGSLLASGLVSALAVLTRPNLAVIGAAIVAYLAARFSTAVEVRRSRALPLLFALPFAAGCLTVLWLHHYLYGSALTTGYGRPESFYAMEHVAANVKGYSTWLLDSETPLALAGLAAPFLVSLGRDNRARHEQRRLAVLLAAVVLCVFASYLFYTPYDNWTYLRFLLPAYPSLFVLAAMAVARVAARLTPPNAALVLAAFAAAIGITHLRYIARNSVLTIRASEARYERVARYAGAQVPGRPVFISLLYSGSIAFYSERPTVRWSWIGEHALDETIATIEESGYRSIIVLDEIEEQEFKARFAGETLGKLDWPPRAVLHGPLATRVYDSADRPRYLAGERWKEELIR